MSEQIVSHNKVVSFTYRITDETGKTVEQADIPLEYLHGSPENRMFPKVEAALEGKGVGETVEVTLTPDEAFGQYDPSLTFTDDLDNIPQEYRVVGARPQFQNDKGETLELTVTEIEDDELTLDANHPLAGKTITFHVTIDGVREAHDSELTGSFPADPGTLH